VTSNKLYYLFKWKYDIPPAICTHEHISIQIIHSHNIISEFSHFLKCYVHLLPPFNSEISFLIYLLILRSYEKLCGNDEEHSAPTLRKQVKAKVQWL